MRSNHCVTVESLPTETIWQLLKRADAFAKGDHAALRQRLAGKVMAPLFYEPSTRTRSSFEIAAKRLGMDVIYFDADVSSVTKGESLLDTLKTLEAMGVDVAVLRHQHNDVFDALSGKLDVALINAGNGTRAHPTQALLDWFTMMRTFGTAEGLTVAIVGDILHSRVARSHVAGLPRLGARAIVSGPDAFRDAEVEKRAPYVPFEDALQEADVVMMLRIQRERLKADLKWELDGYLWRHGLTGSRLKLLKPRAIIMHPGPVNRDIEIESALIHHPRSRILEQVRNGVYVRMAVLEYVLTGGSACGAADSASQVLSYR